MEKYRALPAYYDILRGAARPNYLKTREIGADFDPDSDIEGLWRAHTGGLSRMGNGWSGGAEPGRSLLDLKALIADRLLASCILCERKCRVDRKNGESGTCGVLESRVSSEFTHWGEEKELVPSYTIFFAGCTFKCVFCQNWDISQNPKAGRHIRPARLVEKLANKTDIARNVNWVGGDPTSNLGYILGVLALADAPLPQVWNSNMYLTVESMSLLMGVTDVYLTDFKYGNDECARELSDVEDYVAVTKRNHLIARGHAEMIIRHLVLPGHADCCSKPLLEWISENLEGVLVNVMDQYRPEYQAHGKAGLDARLGSSEYDEVRGHAVGLGLTLTD